MSAEICKHGLYGTLCHICFPEWHTYLALVGDEYKKFTAPGSTEAIQKAKKLKAVGLFQSIHWDRT